MPGDTMQQQRLTFITIAGHTIGFGHLSRCLALAKHAARNGWSISFLVFGTDEAASRIQQAGHPYVCRPLESLGDQITEADIGDAPVATVVDASHPVILGDRARARKMLEEIRGLVHTVVVIDALGPQTFFAQLPDMPIDILVVPYVGADGTTGAIDAAWQTLRGPAYAVLAPAYSGLPERSIRAQADRILVSCGGSDPLSLSATVLKGIERLPGHLTVRVIVGPLVDRHLKDALLAMSAASTHAIEVVHAPDGLADLMRWCDLAITTSGLTKYELAATSTPAIMLSLSEADAAINQPFANVGSIVDLGHRCTPQLIEDHVTRLLADPDARAAMAVAGRLLVDGKGAERVINEITRSCRALE